MIVKKCNWWRDDTLEKIDINSNYDWISNGLLRIDYYGVCHTLCEFVRGTEYLIQTEA